MKICGLRSALLEAGEGEVANMHLVSSEVGSVLHIGQSQGLQEGQLLERALKLFPPLFLLQILVLHKSDATQTVRVAWVSEVCAKMTALFQRACQNLPFLGFQAANWQTSWPRRKYIWSLLPLRYLLVVSVVVNLRLGLYLILTIYESEVRAGGDRSAARVCLALARVKMLAQTLIVENKQDRFRPLRILLTLIRLISPQRHLQWAISNLVISGQNNPKRSEIPKKSRGY